MNNNINICIISGKIITDIDFKFFYNSKLHNSIVEFDIEINYENSTRRLSKTNISIKAFDENADLVYRWYKKGDFINIIGKMTSKYIEINEIRR